MPMVFDVGGQGLSEGASEEGRRKEGKRRTKRGKQSNARKKSEENFLAQGPCVFFFSSTSNLASPSAILSRILIDRSKDEKGESHPRITKRRRGRRRIKKQKKEGGANKAPSSLSPLSFFSTPHLSRLFPFLLSLSLSLFLSFLLEYSSSPPPSTVEKTRLALSFSPVAGVAVVVVVVSEIPGFLSFQKFKKKNHAGKKKGKTKQNKT
jgi:hypothetical protein